MIDHLSVSQIQLYLRCPRAYYFKYIVGTEEPLSLALVEGSSLHETLRLFNTRYITSTETMSHLELLKIFQDIFQEKSKQLTNWENQGHKGVYRRIKGILKLFLTEVHSTFPAEKSEWKFHTKIAEVSMVGIIDTISRGSIIDYKLAGNPFKISDEYLFQLGVYLAATNIPQGRCCIFGRWHHTVKMTEAFSLSVQSRKAIEDVVSSVAYRINKQDFQPRELADCTRCRYLQDCVRSA